MDREKPPKYLWWHKKAGRLWWLMLLIIGIAVIVIFGDFLWWMIINTSEEDVSIKVIYAVAIVVFTGLLLILAWYQANEIRFQAEKISKTSRTDLLLRIDREYGSPKIIEARIILHEFHCQVFDKKITSNNRNQMIGDLINDMRNKEKQAKKFMYLHNFLDFLETVAYFCKKKDISEDDVRELIGPLRGYYTMFEKLISSLRREVGPRELYKEIEDFANKKNKH
ncbi:MAG: hypothetical protein V3V61_03895 [Gammaproteobacteria bacterium]